MHPQYVADAPVLFAPNVQLYIMKNIHEQTEDLRLALTNAYQDFISTLEQFDDEQINKNPFKGSWTPGQVADHIIKATGGIPDKYTEPANRPFDEKVAAMESVFLDFEAKFKSPDFVVPDSGPFNKQILIKTLHSLLERHLQKTADADLTALCLKFELPTIGAMTRYEWMKFIVAHTKRHKFQLNNMLKVMAQAKTS